MKRNAWPHILLLLILTTALVWPLFRLEYLDNWTSIESTFIADARMLRDRLPHPSWQPLWYCGTRFDYVYPPGVRYGTAVISKFSGVSTARAYHFFTGTFYVLGIAAVYWLVRVGSQSRRGALLASLGVAMLSPSFLLLPAFRHDSLYRVPQRLHVLMAYGEGPHICALCVLPAALALSFVALRRWRPLAFAGAGVLCACTVAMNFYGATALAILFPIATWSVWVSQRERSVWLRAIGIGALAWSLSAFWLTPSYVTITAANLSMVSQPGNNRSWLVALIVIAIFCGTTWRWGKGRPERAWYIFTAGAASLLSLYVLGLFYFGFRVVGEAHRLVPELDLALILGFVEALRAFWRRPNLRPVVVVALLIAFYPAVRYARHAYSPFPKAGPLESQYQYTTAKWVHDHLPGERVLPSGTVRFWFNAWFDNAQPDGGSMQGMQNQALPDAAWQILHGGRGDIAVSWMQALGADAVIVPDRTSFEPDPDYDKPQKFLGFLPILYDDQHGTKLYRIPRRYPGIGRAVQTAKILEIGKVKGGDDENTLAKYVAVVENPEQSATSVAWNSFEDVEIQTQLSRGQSVLLQETYDTAWHAYENGMPLLIRREPTMNFMLIEVPEGPHTIRLRFETPQENRIGQIISILGLLVVCGLALSAPGPRRS